MYHISYIIEFIFLNHVIAELKDVSQKLIAERSFVEIPSFFVIHNLKITNFENVFLLNRFFTLRNP